MKLLLKTLFIIAILTWIPGGVIGVSADNGELAKSLRKECKKAVKKFEKEGWTVSGVSRTIEQAMEAHYLAVQDAGASAQIIEGSGKAKSVNVAVKKAMNNAASQFSTMNASKVDVRTEMELSNESSSEAESQSSFSSSYVSSSKQKMKNFVPTAVFYRQSSDGTVEAKALYVVGGKEIAE